MPEKIVRIAFRGLMVFNYQTNAATGRRFVEIGFLDARTGSAPGGSHVHTPASSAIHIPRVLTTENGLLADVLDLRKFPGLLGAVREWRLVPVGTPLQPEVTLKGTGPADRKIPPTDDNREDFGWIINLEGADMHATNLTREISTAKLLMVLKVENGEFSTKLISPFLNRQEKGDSEARPFGFSAAVTGLDIKCEVANAEDEGAVDLFANKTLVKRLQPKKGRSTVFEISNAPADVPAEAPIQPGDKGHFHMYYDKLFIQSPPSRQFDFVAIGSAPAPDPTLCGVTYLGQRDDPL